MKYSIEALDNMEGHEFEYAVADLLRYNGWRDVKVTQGSGDYGIDILARRGSTQYAIQCKRYSNAVGVKAVQEAGLGVDYYHCDAAAVITNNTFTKQAENIARTTGVRLWGRDFLLELIRNYDDGYDEFYAQPSAGTSKVCPVCKREFFSSSTMCPVCKCDLVHISAQKRQNMRNQKPTVSQERNSQLSQIQPQHNINIQKTAVKSKGKSSLNKASNLSITALVFSCLGCLCVIGVILAIIDLTKKDGRKKNLSVISLVIACLWPGIFSSIIDQEHNAPSNTINSNISSYSSEQVIGTSPEITKELSMEERLWNAIIENVPNVDEESLIGIRYIPENNYTSITFMAPMGFSSKGTIKATHITISEILESIQPFIDTDVEICVKCSVVDVYGNPSVVNVILADYTLDTIQKINFDRFNPTNSPAIADSWWNHSLFEME